MRMFVLAALMALSAPSLALGRCTCVRGEMTALC